MSESTLLPKKILICLNNCVQYNNIKTSTNDPSITQSMRYSQLVKNRAYVTSLPPPNKIYSYKTPLFTRHRF